ncbi:unnamed protein product [Polarella glacialis]|uniref:Uncharacterized protein n=1 Tax=Polarella glacialis TaxID=89957 RepID=A0A813LRD0_POLGL|nr:unnamed protein product [Polarella glacialis]
MRPTEKRGQMIPFSYAVAWINGMDRDAINNLDGHFQPQSEHCELSKRIREYNMVIRMTRDSLAVDAVCLLEQAGLSRLNTMGDDGNNTPFWRRPEVQAFHPGKDNEEYLKKFYTKQAAEDLLKVFAADYQTFNIPRPAWIDKATGEFFNDAGSVRCEPRAAAKRAVTLLESGSGGLQQLAEMEDDEDGIAVHAKRAGYAL